MAPKTFSMSFSSLSLPRFLTNRTPKLLRIYPPPTTFIICKSTRPQTRLKTPPPTASSDTLQLSVPSSEPDGTGPSVPTRGELFIQYHHSIAASKVGLEGKKKRKKKDKPTGSRKVSNAAAYCYGCGAPLHTSEIDAPGYVDLDTFELKKKHHQLRTVLCGRCKLLSHGHMITAVGGNGGYPGGKQFVTAEELREKLSHLRFEKALIVKLVDIVDFNGSFLARVRDLAGANPIILVATKVDLLPKGTDLNCVGDWVVEATMKKKLNVLSVHLTSSKSLVGIAGVVSKIQKEKKGRDVYILGSANVGKSAFINALLKTMARNDPVAAAAQKYRPIQSAVPGTTLGPIQIEAFPGGEKLYDTPGVHLHHRQAAVVHSKDLSALAPQSRLRGQTFSNSPPSSEEWTTGTIESNGLNGFSIFWGGLVRIDILKALPHTGLTFYGPKTLHTHLVPTDRADEFYWKEVGGLLTPPTGKEGADEWKGLETARQLQIKFEDTERLACDVAISGLGWIRVEPISKSMGVSDAKINKGLDLAVHVPKPVEIFVRPSLPVGKSGGEKYQYRELTEKEQEVRPKWYL